jgi:protein-L-isoaspartate(D-aspartate) O-methyltransferase
MQQQQRRPIPFGAVENFIFWQLNRCLLEAFKEMISDRCHRKNTVSVHRFRSLVAALEGIFRQSAPVCYPKDTINRCRVGGFVASRRLNHMNKRVFRVSDYSSRRTMMVDTQVRPSDVTKFPIIDAMLSTPREAYVPDALREAAYVGENLDIGGRTLLDPRTLAKMLDALNIDLNDVVLDVGCGLGYSTAVIAGMAEFVVGVEDDADRATDAQANLSENGVDNAAVVEGALNGGAAKSGPFDIIILQGAVDSVPATLTDQLRDQGRIAAIFAQGALGVVRIGHKIDGEINWRDVFNASAPMLAGFERPAAFAF